jgi:hypothetical protein
MTPAINLLLVSRTPIIADDNLSSVTEKFIVGVNNTGD